MKHYISSLIKYTSKLIIFYIFLLIFGSIIYFFFLKPIVNNTLNPQSLSVSGISKSEYVPDLATINAGLLKEGSDIKVLKVDTALSIENAINELEGIGIEEEKIKSNYNIEPKYDKDNINITGYVSNATIKIETNDFTKIDSILEILMKNNLNRINGVNFSYDNYDEIKESLRSEAINNAEEKAQRIANESGLRLGKLLNVLEGYNSYYPRYDTINSLELSATQDSSSGYNPGENELEVNVTLIYEIL